MLKILCSLFFWIKGNLKRSHNVLTPNWKQTKCFISFASILMSLNTSCLVNHLFPLYLNFLAIIIILLSLALWLFGSKALHSKNLIHSSDTEGKMRKLGNGNSECIRIMLLFSQYIMPYWILIWS